MKLQLARTISSPCYADMETGLFGAPWVPWLDSERSGRGSVPLSWLRPVGRGQTAIPVEGEA